MSKITPVHLARQAIVYIRQSTADQVINNPESRRRQYGLQAFAACGHVLSPKTSLWITKL